MEIEHRSAAYVQVREQRSANLRTKCAKEVNLEAAVAAAITFIRYLRLIVIG
jgi:hypothetical protein